jgi:flagellar biosynthesis protein FliQ
MTDTGIIHLASMMMITAAKLSAPILITALLVGFGISLLQALTQVQDMTLSFVPKIVGVAIAILVSGNWMINELVSFTHEAFAMLPTLLSWG